MRTKPEWRVGGRATELWAWGPGSGIECEVESFLLLWSGRRHPNCCSSGHALCVHVTLLLLIRPKWWRGWQPKLCSMASLAIRYFRPEFRPKAAAFGWQQDRLSLFFFGRNFVQFWDRCRRFDCLLWWKPNCFGSFADLIWRSTHYWACCVSYCFCDPLRDCLHFTGLCMVLEFGCFVSALEVLFTSKKQDSQRETLGRFDCP